MIAFTSPRFWSTYTRFAAFWAIAAGVTLVAYSVAAPLSISHFVSALFEALGGSGSQVATREFAVSAAAALLTSGLGLAVAFGLLHALMASFAIAQAHATVEATDASKGGPGLAAGRAAVRSALMLHPLIGDAWADFDDTLITGPRPGDPLQAPVRPQSLLNIEYVKTRLFGLRVMPAIPRVYFALGLLLTLVGLLHVLAGDAGSTAEAAGHVPPLAAIHLSALAAGLAAAIGLGSLFRGYQAAVEASIARLCRSVERRVVHLAPEAISAEMNQSLIAQLAELQALNASAFGERFAKTLAEPLQQSMDKAVAPLIGTLTDSIGRLESANRAGVDDLVARFLEGVRGGVGVEFNALSTTLVAMQDAMERTRQGLIGSGSDLSTKIQDGADRIMSLLAGAGATLSTTAQTSGAAMQEMILSMQVMLEDAHRRIDADLGTAAGGASSKLEAAMGRVLERLEHQVATLNTSIAGYQESITHQLAESARRATSTHEGTVAIIDNGMGRVLDRLEQQVAGLNSSIAGFQEGLSQHLFESGQRAASAHESTMAIIDNGMGRVIDRIERQVSSLQISINGFQDGMAQHLAESTQRAAITHEGTMAIIDDGMDRVLQRLEQQVSGLNSTIAGFQDGMVQHLVESGRRLSLAHEGTIANMDKGMDRVLQRLELQVGALQGSIGTFQDGMAQHLVESGHRLATAHDTTMGIIDNGMGRVLQRLEHQVAGLQASIFGFQDGLAQHLAESGQRTVTAHEGTIAVLNTGMDRILGQLEQQVAGLNNSIAGFQNGMAQHLVEAGQRTASAHDSTMTIIDSGMARVLQRLEQHVAGLQASIAGFQDGMAQHLVESGQRTASAHEGTLAIIDDGMSRVLQRLEQQVADLHTSIAGFQDGMSQHLVETGRRTASAHEGTMAIIDNGMIRVLDRLEQHVAGLQTSIAGFQDGMAQHLSEVGRTSATVHEGTMAIIDNGMSRVLQRLEQQVAGLHTSIAGFQDGMAQHLAETGQRAATQHETAISIIEDGLGRMLEHLGQQAASLHSSIAGYQDSMAQHLADSGRQTAKAHEGTMAIIDNGMSRVLQRLEQQVAGLNGSIANFQEAMALHLAETSHRSADAHNSMTQQLHESRRRTIEAQEAALAMIDKAASSAASVLQTGLAPAVSAINAEVDRMIDSMRTAEASMQSQAGAVQLATTQSIAVADSFGRTAELVRSASGPLLQSSDRMAGATAQLSEAMQQAAVSFDDSQQAAKALAEHLASHIDHLSQVWTRYEGRFGEIDADLGNALALLSAETHKQLDILAKQTIAIDRGLSTAVDKLSIHVAGIAEGTGDLAEQVSTLRTALTEAAVPARTVSR